MKFLSITAFLILFCFSSVCAQEVEVKRGIPEVVLKTTEGKNYSSKEMIDGVNPTVLVIWKSCCPPNIKMLDEIAEVCEDWKKETGVRVFAVSVDDARNMSKVGPLKNAKEWPFEVLLDPNSDFKRGMNVNDTPHVFVFDTSGNCVWQRTTYNPGEENEIYDVLKKMK